MDQPTEIRPLLRHLLLALRAGAATDYLAAAWHGALIRLIDLVAQEQEVTTLAFSGGVWQNAVLVDLAAAHLRGKYRLLWHQQLSPNDECIAFGQLQLWQQEQRKSTIHASLPAGAYAQQEGIK